MIELATELVSLLQNLLSQIIIEPSFENVYLYYQKHSTKNHYTQYHHICLLVRNLTTYVYLWVL